MEDLLVSRISWSTDLKLTLVLALPKSRPDILDVSYNYIRTLPFQISVLTASDGANVRGYTSVDNDILLACILVDIQTTKNKEAVAKMQLAGETAQFSMQIGKRKCLLRYVAKAELQGYSIQSSTSCNNKLSATQKGIDATGNLHLKCVTALSISASWSVEKT
jgi:hypothetical protein